MDRPTIIVDLDGPVYPWVHVMAHVMSNIGATDEDPHYLIETQRSYEVWEDWDIPKGLFWMGWRKAIESGVVYGKGNPELGALDALWKLSDNEWHIHIATSRLTKFGIHDIVVENTVTWLSEHTIPYRSLSFTDRKTDMVAEAIVDDQVVNFNHLNHDKMFLHPAQPWHQECHESVVRLERDDPWQQVLEALL